MNREDKLALLVSKVNEWPKPSFNGTGTILSWSFQDDKYIHPDYDPITIDDWNRAKIVPNTKIRILSPEHSEYVQKLAFEVGFSWLGDKVTQYTSEIALFFWDDYYICHSNNHRSFDNPEDYRKEIFIELPARKIEENPFKAFSDAVNKAFPSRVLAEKVGAADVLTAGANHLNDRAATYDSAEGERSMGATVEAFENITGHSLTEEQGWLFMVLLKAVRSQQGNYKLDNYEDGAAYFALMAESASEARK
jgi:hypothetical protein